VPGTVIADTADYQEEMDQLGNFVRCRRRATMCGRGGCMTLCGLVQGGQHKGLAVNRPWQGHGERDIKKHRSNYVYYMDVALVDVPDGDVASGTDPDADRWVPNYGDDDG